MTNPRWTRAQQLVEAALTSGPKAVTEIRHETGLSYNTVLACLERAEVQRQNTWPASYVLIESAFSGLSVKAAPLVVHAVKPIEIPMEEVGPRWQANRAKIGQEIAQLDLTKLSLSDAIKHFEIEASSLVGIVEQLRAVKDGPDWRQQIGLDL